MTLPSLSEWESEVFQLAIVFACITVGSLVLLSLHRVAVEKSVISPVKSGGQGYILENIVSHSRFLPSPSAHSFTYPTLSVLVSLNALESHSLDLWCGFLFGYGSVLGRVTALRANAYFQSGQNTSFSIRAKLVDCLRAHGLDQEAETFDDAWIMTMPSYFGFEGINPLTVYYCYDSERRLCVVILEIHNTFGERHVHILKPGVGEDTNIPNTYDHKWTFPRQFHVSPFNDRSGFYSVSVTSPPPPYPSPSDAALPPIPKIRVSLYTSHPVPKLKLTASINPISSEALTAPNLIRTLVKYPLTLFLSMPRILFQASKLHFRKKLRVYARPEPWIESELGPERNEVQQGKTNGGPIGWQSYGLLDIWARRIVEAFLEQRCRELDRHSVRLVPSNPSEEIRTFSSISNPSSSQPLDIYYRSPRFFSMLVLSPSAQHALVFGHKADRLFKPSSEKMFLELFNSPSNSRQSKTGHAVQHLRIRNMSPPEEIDPSLVREVMASLPKTGRHPFDILPLFKRVALKILTLLLIMVEMLEKWIFSALGARFVQGDAPWEGWRRLEVERDRLRLRSESDPLQSCPASTTAGTGAEVRSHLGSVRDDGW